MPEDTAIELAQTVERLQAENAKLRDSLATVGNALQIMVSRDINAMIALIRKALEAHQWTTHRIG